VGRASAKQPYRLARSRAVPKGRPGAKRSGHTRRWEWRKDARPSATEKLLLPCGVRQLERGKNRLVRYGCGGKKSKQIRVISVRRFISDNVRTE